MKLQQTAFASAFLTFGLVAGAQAVGVSSITVTAAQFSLGLPISGTCSSPNASNFSGCVNAAIGTENTIAAGFTGGARADSLPQVPNDIVNFNFFGTNPSNRVTTDLFNTAVGAAPANDWTTGFQGTVNLGGDNVLSNGDVVSLNLGGFYATWNGTNFLQGTNSAGPNGTSTSALGTITGVTNATTGAFTVAWQSYITGGPFDTQTGYWNVSGNVAAVPEASTYGMMLAGLGLVGAMVARRRKLG